MFFELFRGDTECLVSAVAIRGSDKMNIKEKILEIQRDKHLLRRLTAVIIGRSGLGTIFKLKIKVWDYYIYLHPTGLSSLHWCNPTVRSEDYEFISSFLKEGDIYVDIGANIGTTVIPAAKQIGERGKAIAFEAHPKIYSYLLENIALNNLSNIQTYNCAVGSKQGHIFLSDKFRDETNRVLDTKSKNSLKIPIIVLNDFFEKHKMDSISLLKIDTEGYEKFILEGATEILKKVNCIYFEVSQKNFNYFKYQTSDILTLLEQHDFAIFKIKIDNKELISVGSQYVPSSTLHENLLAIKDIENFQERTRWKVRALDQRS